MDRLQATVHVVDDDESFRKAILRLLRAAGYTARGYGSVAEFLSADPASAPGCVITDLRMPGPSGLDLQAALVGSDNPLPVIFLSAHGDIPTTVRAMRGGAVDFLTKPVEKADLFDAIRGALEWDAAAREHAAHMDELRGSFRQLTPREREVVAHVIAGKLNKQIGFELGIAERTVKAHRANIMRKLQVQSTADLVRFAESLNLQPAGARVANALSSNGVKNP